MILIGHDNYLNIELVSAILKSDSSPVKRLRKAADEKGTLINATAGHKTRSVIVLTTGQVILCALQPGTVKERMDNPD
jgi:extracellular matrix regulatory protein A